MADGHNHEDIPFGILLSCLAAAATLIGGGLALLVPKAAIDKYERVAMELCGVFAAVVFFAVSFLHVLPEATWHTALGLETGAWVPFVEIDGSPQLNQRIPIQSTPSVNMLVFAGVIGGMFVTFFLHWSETTLIRPRSKQNGSFAFFFALAMLVHNIPEGFAVFYTSTSERNTGIPLAISIALHNIPEGFLVALAVFIERKSRLAAFLWCLFPTLAEPILGLALYFMLREALTEVFIGVLMAVVAGLMIALSLLMITNDQEATKLLAPPLVVQGDAELGTTGEQKVAPSVASSHQRLFVAVFGLLVMWLVIGLIQHDHLVHNHDHDHDHADHDEHAGHDHHDHDSPATNVSCSKPALLAQWRCHVVDAHSHAHEDHEHDHSDCEEEHGHGEGHDHEHADCDDEHQDDHTHGEDDDHTHEDHEDGHGDEHDDDHTHTHEHDEHDHEDEHTHEDDHEHEHEHGNATEHSH